MATKSTKISGQAVPSSTPSRRLIPRMAPPAEALPVPLVDQQAATEAASTPVTVPKTRKPNREDLVLAKHQQALAEALVMAQAIKYDQPKVVRPSAVDSKKGEKSKFSSKPKKQKLARGDFRMPEAEFTRIAELKKRLKAMHFDVKKNELLRAGLGMLYGLNDVELLAVIGRLQGVKAARRNAA